MAEHQSGCLICGKDLVYLDSAEKISCIYCKSDFDSDVKCEDGHYICDSCHSMDANDIIEQYCLESELADPLQLAFELMKHPRLKMHGPEHHFLVPAVLITAYYNVKKEEGEKKKALKKARSRSDRILGGFCGTHGNCGAAVGTGIFISTVTGTTPLSKKEWMLSNMMTSLSLREIALHGGPRCCKRNTYIGIIEAVKFVSEHLDVEIDINENIKCEFYGLNKECLEDECKYYQQ